ncbi:MAG: response regulator transcription factor [Chloroflexota bacterium]
MPKIRVLVVDDHAIVRDGICALLNLTGDIEVVGEATNGSEALKLVQELNPDVVIMDISMPTAASTGSFPIPVFWCSPSTTTRSMSSR